MVEVGGVGNVGENFAAEGGAVGEELGDEVGEVNGRVDADGGEGCSAVHSWWEGRWGKGFEVGKGILEPSIFSNEFFEPVCNG